MKMKMEEPRELVQSVSRALDILEEIVLGKEGLSLTEISENLQLNKSTVHRLLSTLIYRGYVRREKNSHCYTAGFRLLEISSSIKEKLDLKQTNVFLTELMRVTNETVHLGILHEGEVVYVDKVESEQTIRMHSRLGSRVPIYATSLGKILLAYSTPDVVEAIVSDMTFKPLTENTITDANEFRRQLNEVKNLGYSIDDEENEENIRCIGGPIFGSTGQIVAAFSVSGPAFRMTTERLEELKPVIRDFSKRMSALFGYGF